MDAKLQETMRFNTERRMIGSLAPEKWEELRRAVKAACRDAVCLNLKYEETPKTLVIKRFEGGLALKTLTLTYDETVPRITWKCCDPLLNTGSIHFALHGLSLHLIVNDAVQVMPDIVFMLTSCLTTN